MYKVIGIDGKEYGPVPLEDLQKWIAQGRVNSQTKLKPDGGEWKSAVEYPDVQALLAAASLQPPNLPTGTAYSQPPQQGLSIASLVLGVLSILCLSILTGIPAIICGHIARSRAKKFPEVYGGAGLALAGLIMGYISVVMAFLIIPAMLLPALAKAKSRAQMINCSNKMKQVGLATKMWAVDHEGVYPFALSTNAGGSLELASQDAEGFDRDPATHFRLMSDFLQNPEVLVCPADKSVRPAPSFDVLQAGNVSYRLRTSTNITDFTPTEVLAVCPIHQNVLRADGSVHRERGSRGR